MTMESCASKIHVTAVSNPKNVSSFLDVTPPPPQALGSLATLTYIYSTPPSFTFADNADLNHYQNTASSGPPYHFPAAGSSVVTHISFHPNTELEEGFWHRTQTVDYIVVLEGELELSLDGGQKRALKKGDVVIQRAPMHRWKNLSRTERASYVAVLLGALGAREDGVEYGGEHME